MIGDVVPNPNHISNFLESSLGMLTESRAVSLNDFLELRELLEVFVARCAAERRTTKDLDALRRPRRSASSSMRLSKGTATVPPAP